MSLVDKAVDILQAGGVIIFPTDTVWGIGASLANPQAVKKLYQIKKRNRSQPTAVLVGSIVQAKQLAELDKKSLSLLNQYWPGGLTVVVKAKEKTPSFIKGRKKGRATIGLRMPDHQLCLKILKKLPLGLVAASANFAGQPAPTKRKEIDPRLINQADLLLSGQSRGKLASTVLDLTEKPFKALRKGPVVPEKLTLDK